MLRKNEFRAYLRVVILLVFLGFNCLVNADSSAVGSREDRQALFDYLLAKTMEREAFSPVKNRRLGFDVRESMLAYEQEVVNASTEEGLFYALAKLSNARHDRHLSVWAIEGGLAAPVFYPEHGERAPVAPIRVEFDYETFELFVSDVASKELPGPVELGDVVLGVNGVSVAAHYEATRPYFRYSTEHGYRKKYSQGFASRTGRLPSSMYRQTLDLKLLKKDDRIIDVSLPYERPEHLEWVGDSRELYPGFELVADRGAFDLYASTAGLPVLVIDWHRFNRHLVEDMNWLMDYAASNNLLDHDIVWDGVRSGGGSLGAYAVQRLSPHPFKTTFGNLRISDVIPEFIARRSKAYSERKAILDGTTYETIDDGTWLIDWLTDDVQKAIDHGQAYSNNVPFKLAHAPKYSDGIIYPAEIHFRGRMVCLFGPAGGSHLDQFFSIVTDNELCDTIGMQTGGYSNTWEWEEEVVFPTTGKPVIGFMWNIGHTITPGGRILEGDPSEIGEHVPLTRQNAESYEHILLNRALELLGHR